MAPSNFIVVYMDEQFEEELQAAGSKLVIADFTSAGCGPCQRIAPAYEEMAARYPQAVFLKIDIQTCPDTALALGVTATPTFIFYKNKVKLDTVRGANIEVLEAKVRQYYGDGSGTETEDCGVPGHIDLLSMVNKSNCECLNESDDHPLAQMFTPQEGYLESDADEQLIIYLEFNQSVKLHSLRLKGPLDSGPKSLKLFINQTHTLDFDAAESNMATQEIEIGAKELAGDLIPLKYVKFQNIHNVTFFIADNQQGTELTRLSYMQLIGSPVQTTNMADFKRVAGKKGESHF